MKNGLIVFRSLINGAYLITFRYCYMSMKLIGVLDHFGCSNVGLNIRGMPILFAKNGVPLITMAGRFCVVTEVEKVEDLFEGVA